jgi:hypothetical protein
LLPRVLLLGARLDKAHEADGEKHGDAYSCSLHNFPPGFHSAIPEDKKETTCPQEVSQLEPVRGR